MTNNVCNFHQQRATWHCKHTRPPEWVSSFSPNTWRVLCMNKRCICMLGVTLDSQQDEELEQMILHVTQFRHGFSQQDLLGLQPSLWGAQSIICLRFVVSKASRRAKNHGYVSLKCSTAFLTLNTVKWSEFNWYDPNSVTDNSLWPEASIASPLAQRPSRWDTNIWTKTWRTGAIVHQRAEQNRDVTRWDDFRCTLMMVFRLQFKSSSIIINKSLMTWL